MLEGLFESISRNKFVLIITVLLCVVLINSNTLIKDLMGNYYSLGPDITWFIVFISIFFFAITSLALEQNKFSTVWRFILPLILGAVMCGAYIVVLLMLNDRTIDKIFDVYLYNRWSAFWLHSIRILQTIFILMIFGIVRFILVELLRDDIEEDPSRLGICSSLQSIALASISAIAIFLFIPSEMVKGGMPFYAGIFTLVFLLYHSYWNYNTILINNKNNRNFKWLLVFMQLIIFGIIILVLPILLKHLGWKNADQLFFGVILLLAMVLNIYTWVFFLLGVILVFLTTFLSRRIGYRILHWMIFSFILCVTILANLNEVWLAISVIIFIYGFACCLYGVWSKLLLLICFGRNKPD